VKNAGRDPQGSRTHPTHPETAQESGET